LPPGVSRSRPPSLFPCLIINLFGTALGWVPRPSHTFLLHGRIPWSLGNLYVSAFLWKGKGYPTPPLQPGVPSPPGSPCDSIPPVIYQSCSKVLKAASKNKYLPSTEGWRSRNQRSIKEKNPLLISTVCGRAQNDRASRS